MALPYKKWYFCTITSAPETWLGKNFAFDNHYYSLDICIKNHSFSHELVDEERERLRDKQGCHYIFNTEGPAVPGGQPRKQPDNDECVYSMYGMTLLMTGDDELFKHDMDYTKVQLMEILKNKEYTAGLSIYSEPKEDKLKEFCTKLGIEVKVTSTTTADINYNMLLGHLVMRGIGAWGEDVEKDYCDDISRYIVPREYVDIHNELGERDYTIGTRLDQFGRNFSDHKNFPHFEEWLFLKWAETQ